MSRAKITYTTISHVCDGALELRRGVLHHVQRRLRRAKVWPLVFPIISGQERSVTPVTRDAKRSR